MNSEFPHRRQAAQQKTLEEERNRTTKTAIAGVLTVIFALVLLVSCGKKGEKARDETLEALSAAKDYAFDKKDDYYNMMKDAVGKAADQITTLKDRASEIPDASKEEYEAAMKVLDEKRDAAMEKLGEAKDATKENWNDARKGAKAAVEELGKALDNAKKFFN